MSDQINKDNKDIIEITNNAKVLDSLNILAALERHYLSITPNIVEASGKFPLNYMNHLKMISVASHAEDENNTFQNLILSFDVRISEAEKRIDSVLARLGNR